MFISGVAAEGSPEIIPRKFQGNSKEIPRKFQGNSRSQVLDSHTHDCTHGSMREPATKSNGCNDRRPTVAPRLGEIATVCAT